MGQTVQTFEGFDAAGTVRVDWNGMDRNGAPVPSGVYFYRVTTPEWSATKKMTLLK
jgi:flagellar hook assembly protein FlgD